MAATALRFRNRWITLTNGVPRMRARPVGIAKQLAAAAVLAYCLPAAAQVNGVGDHPYLGWSSFSEQTISSNFLTQANMMAQSDALAASGLQQHGFNYINIDSGWMGSFDGYGRPIPNPATFPDIAALAAHVHANGQKLGIYWIPGLQQPAVDANSPILGTPYHTQDIMVVPHVPGNAFSSGQFPPYHEKIDFTKPGAQAYVDSVVALFASWGVDFIKLDGVTPGSYDDSLTINNLAEVQAWSAAIAHSGRPIWFTVSWSLDADYLSTWQQFANARRIDEDVECESRCTTLTDWPRITERFYDEVAWEHAAGPTVGWNDLDTLDVGTTLNTGLNETEQHAALTFWAMANAPLYLGGDLTTLSDAGKRMLSNDEVLAIDRSGHPAIQVRGDDTPVWMMKLDDGTVYVALFNMDAIPVPVEVRWRDLGFTAAHRIHDVWNDYDLRPNGRGLEAVVPGHGTRLFRIHASGKAPAEPATSYEAATAVLGGSAGVYNCPPCSGGLKVGGLGLGLNNTVTFDSVTVPRAGVYQMTVDYMTDGLRAANYSINGGPWLTLNVGGGSGSFTLPVSSTVPVALHAGTNTIRYGNPTSYPPDLDRIVISGDGSATLPVATAYEAENAVLGGSAGTGYCKYCSGASKANGLGFSGTVTFTNITVPRDGMYQMEIDYLVGGQRSFFLSVNGAAATELPLNGNGWDAFTATVVPVQLHAGANTIEFSNPSNYAPDLDRIVIVPPRPDEERH
jgi:alpha-galactosidase